MENGSDKTTKLEMLNKYPAPSNCLMLKALALNPEVKPIMSKYSIKKDCIQELVQRQLGAGICAVGSVLTDFLNKKSDDDETKKFINTLCDAGRIFSDCHHSISTSRRSFIIPSLNFTAKGVAAENKIDTLLFGKDFAEKFKSATAMEKTGKDLANKIQGKRNSSTNDNKGPKPKNRYPARDYENLNSNVKSSSRCNSNLCNFS